MDIKPQDILFFITLAGLLYIRKPQLFVVVGLICFVVSMPLFALWIFFTAQRLVWYGAGFILIAVLWNIWTLRND